VGVLLGCGIRGEPFHGGMLWGLAVILLGVGLVQGLPGAAHALWSRLAKRLRRSRAAGPTSGAEGTARDEATA